MECSLCGKARAVARMRRDDDVGIVVCRHCLEAAGRSIRKELGFDLAQFYCHLVRPAESVSPLDLAVISQDRSCPGCSATFGEISRIGQLGCAQCYLSFAEVILPALHRLHEPAAWSPAHAPE